MKVCRTHWEREMMASKELLERLVKDFAGVAVTRAVILPGEVQTQSQTQRMASVLQQGQSPFKSVSLKGQA